MMNENPWLISRDCGGTGVVEWRPPPLSPGSRPNVYRLACPCCQPIPPSHPVQRASQEVDVRYSMTQPDFAELAALWPAGTRVWWEEFTDAGWRRTEGVILCGPTTWAALEMRADDPRRWRVQIERTSPGPKYGLILSLPVRVIHRAGHVAVEELADGQQALLF